MKAAMLTHNAVRKQMLLTNWGVAVSIKQLYPSLTAIRLCFLPDVDHKVTIPAVKQCEKIASVLSEMNRQNQGIAVTLDPF